jgi:hypothetical protein
MYIRNSHDVLDQEGTQGNMHALYIVSVLSV